jgi:phosphoglycerate kinase
VAILGGAKVSDKLGVIKALLDKVDTMIIGGGMAYTFLKARGHGIGDSLLQEDQVDACRELLESGKRILIPTDGVALGPDDEVETVGTDIADGWKGVDIGPETIEAFSQEIAGAGTVLWNGPMGMFEDDRFAAGTRALAEAVAGGGASLEFIEKGDLPGLEALRKASNAR